MRLLLLSGCCAGLLLITGCESDRPMTKVSDRPVEETTPAEDERAKVERDIAALAVGKDQTKAGDSKTYDDAVSALIRRGSVIETTLIDHLRRSDDWGVRLGLIEVLMATGTRACVDHLIFCLDDDAPLVALRANATLQELTNHNEIPPAGGSMGMNGLPPVPLRAASDLALDAELRQWTTWHQQHGKELRAAWSTWWSAHKDQITIK